MLPSDQDISLDLLKRFSEDNSSKAANDLRSKYFPAPAELGVQSGSEGTPRPDKTVVDAVDGAPVDVGNPSSENGADGLGDPMVLLSALDSDAIRQLLGGPDGSVPEDIQGLLTGGL